jgi:type VI secretion system protein VasI
MKRVFLFSVFIFIGLNAYSQQSLNDELKTASQITNATERLNAYDSILEKHGVKQLAGTGSSDTGKWEASVKTDPITDSKIITFLLEASSGTSMFGKPVYLVIRWDKEDVDMYINWHSYLGSSIDVAFRIGNKPPETKEWLLSTDSQASFYPDDPLPVIKNLLDANQAVARCTPYSESPVTAIFDITGLKVLAKQYDSDLHWLQ